MIKHFVPKLSKIIELGFIQIGKKIHLARKKFFFAVICSIIESRSVDFTELALCLNEDVQVSSNMRRIQRFFAEYELDYLQIAIILMSFIPKHRLTLCIDRTNWKFGQVNINILTLTVYYKGVGVPILWEMLDKRGNSKQSERKDLLKLFINLFGVKRIKCIIGDREFIGDKWYSFLKDSKISFYIRIPKSHWVEHNGSKMKAGDILNGVVRRSLNQAKVNGCRVNIGAKYMADSKDQEDQYLIVVTNKTPDNAVGIYRKRWSIETFFQAIKGRGMDIERTHLRDLERLKKLMAMVSIGFVWCLTIGIWKHLKIKTIKRKKHGYKANSFFRYGMDKLREIFKGIAVKAASFSHVMDVLIAQVVHSNIIYDYAKKYRKIRLNFDQIIC